MSSTRRSSRFQAHKRRATFRQLGDRGVLRGVCRYRRGVAEEARTRGVAAPAFAGCAFVEVCSSEIRRCTEAVKSEENYLVVPSAPGGLSDAMELLDSHTNAPPEGEAF
jgi:hypothetical protein